MKKAIVYMRVSTEDQSTDLQLTAIDRWLSVHGIERVEVYSEKVSGTGKKHRPEFEKLLKRAESGELKGYMVVVYKLDRFARSARQLFAAVETLQSNGVIFASVSDNFDLSNAMGTAMFQLLGVFAQFEVSLIQERTRASYEAKKAMGFPISVNKDGKKKLTSWGRPKIISDETRLKVVSMRAQGKKLSEISEETGVSYPSVSKIICEARDKIKAKF